MLTKTQVAGRLGRCEVQVDRYRKEGRLVGRKEGKRVLFDEADVVRLANELKKGSARPRPAAERQP